MIKFRENLTYVNLQGEDNDPHAEGDMKYKHITEMTILTVQLIVEFAKSLPGFDKLLRVYLITLLKVNIASRKVFILRYYV